MISETTTFERLARNDNPLPSYATKGSAAIDFAACLTRKCRLLCQSENLRPGESQLSWFYQLNGTRYFQNDNDEDPEINTKVTLTISPNETILVPIGFKVQFASRHVLKMFIRSSVAARGLRIANSVGIIDEDYRGELFAMLWNPQKFDISIEHGERIVQGIIEGCVFNRGIKEGKVNQTERGEGGLGSTGRSARGC